MSGVDVLAVMDREIEAIQNTKKMVDFSLSADRQAAYKDHLDSLREARAAVAELIKCCDVTVRAFEALGRTNSIVDQLEAHRNCERALIEQKAALAMTTGAAA